MKPIEFVKNEIRSFKKSEIVLFFLILALVIFVSIYFHDSKAAFISAVCGICYTIFAGYGKVYCYFIGIAGTFCYCYLAYKNGFFGNLALYSLYYFPMEIVGIFKWIKYYDKEKKEIIKTKLNKKERAIYLFFGVFCSFILILVLKLMNDKNPFMDGFSTVFSVIGQLLTVKRCIEQWYVWFFVNLISFFMWFYAVINGAKCAATLIMWGIYLFLAVYFLRRWHKELKRE